MSCRQLLSFKINFLNFRRNGTHVIFVRRNGLVDLVAKEGQLVQVMVSSYTCPTFVLSVAVVLFNSSTAAEKQKVGGVSGTPLRYPIDSN